MATTNDRETGARKLEKRPDLKGPDTSSTGCKGDSPKRPYGLTEGAGEKALHSDGTAVGRHGMGGDAGNSGPLVDGGQP